MPPAVDSAIPRSRFYLIQALRGLAAVLVVSHHQHQAASFDFPLYAIRRWMYDGGIGVDIFFAISGFVMYLSAQRPGIAWQEFAWRRYVRVAPLYYLFTVLKLTLFFLIPATMLHYRFQLGNAVASFLFLPAFNNQHAILPPLVVGWTLNYEMFFYAVVALVLAMRWPLLCTCAGILIALVLTGIFIPKTHAIDAWTSPIVLEFLAGMVIAAFRNQLRRIPWQAAMLLFVSTLVFALANPATSGMLELQPMRALICGIPAALMLASVVALELQRPLQDGSPLLARLRPLLLLGDASYMLYLTHTFIVPATHFLIRPLHLTGALAWKYGSLAASA